MDPTLGWEEGQAHFKGARGLARSLVAIFGNNLPQNPKPVHSIQCQAPEGGGQCPSDVTSFFQRQLASKPVALS